MHETDTKVHATLAAQAGDRSGREDQGWEAQRGFGRDEVPLPLQDDPSPSQGFRVEAEVPQGSAPVGDGVVGVGGRVGVGDGVVGALRALQRLARDGAGAGRLRLRLRQRGTQRGEQNRRRADATSTTRQ
ncbi:Protein of unknown function [Gryllus bimaculatus]|nr:Protein of unknown function [Gryllus bimaculatus]